MERFPLMLRNYEIEMLRDRQADAVYIQLRDLPYDHGRDLDTERHVDYAANGQPIGVALLNVSQGVDVKALPEPHVVAHALGEGDIVVFHAGNSESSPSDHTV